MIVPERVSLKVEFDSVTFGVLKNAGIVYISNGPSRSLETDTFQLSVYATKTFFTESVHNYKSHASLL